MLFSSLTFILCFLPALLLVYFLIPIKNILARRYVLLIFSVLFYSAGEPLYVFAIIACIIFTWFLTGRFDRRNGRIAYVSSILINLLPFLFLKYYDFIADNICGILLTEHKMIGFLPLGISFYTFQMLSYIVDVYHGKVKRQKSPALLALYIFLFPQLIAGPIVRYAEIEKDLLNVERGGNLDSLKQGIERFIVGLGKKVLIANHVGHVADIALQTSSEQMNVGIMWLGALAFTMQIFFDFSGYSDMAIGLGRIFGFSFPENFDRPYCSLSITEFWRRWHMTLGQFFRDYVYIPLGGNRVSGKRWVLNIFIVWILTGFWHGASWNFAIWGLYYGILLLLEKSLLSSRVVRPYESRFVKLARWILTFLIVQLGWVVFYYDSFSLVELAQRLIIMFRFDSGWYSIRAIYPSITADIPWLVLSVIISTPCGGFLRKIIMNERLELAVVKDIVLLGVFVFSIIFIVGGSYNPFIYFRF